MKEEELRWKHVDMMQEQHLAHVEAIREAMANRKEAAKAADLKISPFDEKEDIHEATESEWRRVGIEIDPIA